MATPTFSIEVIIFEQILRFTSRTLAMYPEFTDKLLYLILIPHIVLFLFLASFGLWVAKGNRGFQVLIAIAGYLFFILSGWYGSFLAPFIANFFIIWLAIGFLTFIVVRIIPPIYGPGVRGFGKAVAEKASEKTIGKSVKKKELEKQLRLVNKKINTVRNQPPGKARDKKYMELLELKDNIEHELKEL